MIPAMQIIQPQANEQAPVARSGAFVDKAAKHGWQVVDAPGALRYIDKSKLAIDPSYQRDVAINDRKVVALAVSWSWQACGALLVAERGGLLFVFDGQHRLLAAMKLSAVRELPCVVFQSSSTEAEAEAFLRANKNRKPINNLEQFKARLVVKDRLALAVLDLCEQAGRAVSQHSSATTFSAVTALYVSLSADEANTRRVWPAVAKASAGTIISQRLIRGALWVEQRLAGASLSDPVWSRRMAKVGSAEIEKSMTQAAALLGRTGPLVWGQGLVFALNKGLRSGRLELRDGAGGELNR
jgi:hypothetical protein